MDKRKLEREKLLFRYSAALERGDFDTVDAVLRAAGKDPAMEAMLLEVNAVYTDEGLSGFSRDFDPFKTRTQEAQDGMTASIALNRGARPAPVRTRKSFNFFSMAAVIAVVVFAAAIVTRIPPSEGSNGSFVGANLDQSNQVDTTRCWLIVSAPRGAAVFSRPSASARVVGTLEPGTQVQFVELFDAVDASGAVVGWIYVEANGIAGWIELANAQTSDEACPELAASSELLPTFTATPLPTSVPVAVNPGDAVPPVVSPVEVGGEMPMLPTSTPLPFRPADVTPPPGQFLPTAVNPADTVIAAAEVSLPPFDATQCLFVLETPVAVYVRVDANEPLMTLFDGLTVTVMSRNDEAERYQINAQVGDMLLVGGWIDMQGVSIPAACEVISTGMIRPPADAPPPEGFLTALPPTIVPPFEMTATPLPTFTPTPAGG